MTDPLERRQKRFQEPLERPLAPAGLVRSGGSFRVKNRAWDFCCEQEIHVEVVLKDPPNVGPLGNHFLYEENLN